MDSKLFKHPGRDKPDSINRNALTPQYKRRGIEPVKFASTNDRLDTPDYSGFDGELIDDVNLDPAVQMQDNNDYVFNPKDAAPYNGDAIDECIIVYDGEIIDLGSKEYIQDRVKKIVFGEDSAFGNVAIPQEKISVFKKMEIKVGVFIL